MTKKMLGGALFAAMALMGCAGGGASADPAALDVTTVSSAIDGRTDLFLDPMLSTHLLTADEVNGSPTAQPVEVQITDDMLIAWRAQPSVPAAERSRTEADIVGAYHIVGTVDLSTAQVIDNETHPGDPTQIVLPGSIVGGLRGAHGSSVGSRPPLQRIPTATGIQVNWSNINGIPDEVDARAYGNIRNAHPGCA